MVRPIVLECLDIAGPKELLEAAALGREPCPLDSSWPTQEARCLLQEKRPQRACSLTAPKGEPCPPTAPFASALHIVVYDNNAAL